jgi:serine/threonine-protein kinase
MQSVLAGRYELGEQIGEGGMSVVWRCRDRLLERDVAVKMLAAPGVELLGEDVRAEALATAKVVHPHVASVFDFVVGEIEPGRTTGFIVMELLEGTRLSQVAMPLEPARALQICAEVASALAAAHARGVVHRDIKPSNIMLTVDGVKVFDFGIAAAVGSPGSDLADADIVGTPTYVAPERLLGGPVTGATDVYALGVMLHRLLTGTYPWTITSIELLVFSHVFAEPADLPAIAGLPAPVSEAYRRALAKDPDRRPAAAELAVILAEAVGAVGAVGAVVRTGEGPPATARLPLARPPVTAHRWAPLVAVACLVAVAIVGGAALVTPIVVRALRPPVTETISTLAEPARPVRPETTPAPVVASAGTRPPTIAPPPGGVDVPAGAQTIPGGPGPSSASPSPSAAPSGSAAAPVWFTAAGGQVLAMCSADDQAVLSSWTATDGFKLDQVQPGPATSAAVSFRHGNQTSAVRVTCSAGVPVAQLS